VTEQHQTPVEEMESNAVAILKEEVSLSLTAIAANFENRFRFRRRYSMVAIKLALQIHNGRYFPIDGRLRFRGKATQVLVTWVYDLLPADALKNLHKYDAAIYRTFIEELYAAIDAAPFLEQPADYRAE